MTPLAVHTVDYHTAGEPFRIVVGGVPPTQGVTVLDRRSWAQQHLDHIRAFLVNEPRGHADMYGCFVTPPDDDGAVLGALFFHKDGFSTACGHGTIALARWAIDTGQVTPTGDVTRFCIDVPSGRLSVEASTVGGVVGEIRFTNVASWVSALDVPVAFDAETVTADISYGGAFYASVADGPIMAARLDQFILRARAIKAALAQHPAVIHPEDRRLSGLYGVIFHETLANVTAGARPEGVGRPGEHRSEAAERSPNVTAGAGLHQRNVVVFADGEVDRSPCGSGTSARLAILYARGSLAIGASLHHQGILGTEFTGRVLNETVASGRPAVITQVGGRASRTGFHTFVLEPGDELGLGFQLR